ncbi:GNAT family N-acetyltransferase [Eubacterium multiforme]|uniref:Ribosomal-protein-alanine N-acetyltransferase n=1 Tax=Eubacterium multiforme TaxID=83339 RepID=A0ABT9UVK9_9FIRM|nr:GNAT family protein [Eubacterium multiforme]MDQ0150363.1 ribosomal-protein-alanine N-acetyltransferase [Eubacterium multiforme]
MSSNHNINIALNKGSKKEYLIKDKNSISIGRFSIEELDESNKRCTIDFKFYRENDYNLLRETLELVLMATFKDKNIFKVNIKVSEGINLSPFLDLGFILEGILSDNVFLKGIYKDELILGINREDYRYKNCAPMIQLKGENISLRNLTPSDAENLLVYYTKNKKHLEKFEPTRDNDFFTIESQRNSLNESYKQFLNGTSIDLAIIKDDKIIGKVRLSNIVYGVFKSGILGYSIDEDYQGKGYMKEAVNLVVNYAFKDLDLHRVEASVLLQNERSKGVLLGNGFKKLGINEKYLFINGIWQDHITYYKIKG